MIGCPLTALKPNFVYFLCHTQWLRRTSQLRTPDNPPVWFGRDQFAVAVTRARLRCLNWYLMRGSSLLHSSLNLLFNLFVRMCPLSDTLHAEVFVSLVADVALRRQKRCYKLRDCLITLRSQIVSFTDSAKSRTSKEFSLMAENILFELLIFPFTSS